MNDTSENAPPAAAPSANVHSMVRFEWAVLALALALPSFITWLYFFQAASAPSWVQLVVFPAVKTIQFALPICWIVLALRQKPSIRLQTPAGIGIGLAFGAAVAAAMLGLYYFGLRSSDLFDTAGEQIRAKIAGFQIDTVGKYAGLGIFYSVCHSLLEEYYWRWFVFGRLRHHLPLWIAVFVSAVGFAAHHILVLGKFFGFDCWATWLFSAGVAVGGVAWAWLYQKSASLIGPWLSHLLVDAAIFFIGYDLVREAIAG